MIHFSTFADGDWGVRQAGMRLVNQAKSSGLFDTARCFSLKDLNEVEHGFSHKHLDFIRKYPRGFGYCFWKPTYIQRALSNLAEDEILVSLDAGCQLNLNSQSLNRFHDYIAMAYERHGLFMQLQNNQFGIADLSDLNWSNTRLLNELKPSSEALHSNQIQAGILLVRNSQKVRDLVGQWKYYCEAENYRYILGEVASPQTRWEQSILSLLVKQDDFAVISDETYWFPDWSQGETFPIWAMRNRSGGDAFRRNAFDVINIILAKVSRLL